MTIKWEVAGAGGRRWRVGDGGTGNEEGGGGNVLLDGVVGWLKRISRPIQSPGLETL